MRDIIDAKMMATSAVILSATFCQLLLQTDVSQFQQNQREFDLGAKKEPSKRGKFVIN